MATPTAGIVLAAGGSRRLGQPKQLLRDSQGMTLVEHTVQTLLQGGCAPVFVVTGREHAAITAALAGYAVTVVPNANWESGLGSSVRCGIVALRERVPDPRPQGVVMAACDMPTVTPEHVAALISASAGGRFRVCTTYDKSDNRDTMAPEATQSRGIPALLPVADWDEVERLTGDRGARAILDRSDTLTVFLRHSSFDIDTPADLAQWRAGLPDND